MITVSGIPCNRNKNVRLDYNIRSIRSKSLSPIDFARKDSNYLLREITSKCPVRSRTVEKGVGKVNKPIPFSSRQNGVREKYDNRVKDGFDKKETPRTLVLMG